jgi:4-hydroxyphenylacetate 3-monooxygenase
MGSPRTGREYRESIRDGRRVFIDGDYVDDVTVHPAFRKTVASFAAIYDHVSDPRNRKRLTFETTSGAQVSRAWQMPRSHAELVSRRKVLAELASLSFGFLGRAPEHLATALSGMMMGIDVLAKGNEAGANAFTAYFNKARDEDLFVAYVIQNPQADKSAAVSRQVKDAVLHVLSEDDSGVVVHGAKMLGTSAVMADEIFVGSVQPLGPGEEKYAVSFALPINHPGIRLLSRRSYEAAAGTLFDYPLSSTFDENDAILHFDHVHVPYERLFIYRDIELAAAQWHKTPAHVYQNYQSQIRLSVKLRFLVGLARRVAETNGADNIPQVRSMLSRLASQASLVEGMLSGMEAEGRDHNGFFVPSRHLLYAAQLLTQELYPQVVQAIRDIAGGGVIMLPSSEADFGEAGVRQLIEETQMSPVTDALGRVSVMKLAWDAIGSEFASRHTQYEMFYGGASYVNLAHVWRTYDWPAAAAMVDRALSPYPASKA